MLCLGAALLPLAAMPLHLDARAPQNLVPIAALDAGNTRLRAVLMTGLLAADAAYTDPAPGAMGYPTNTYGLTRTLFNRYMSGNTKAYKCPADKYMNPTGITAGMNRLRSYSANNFIIVPV